jgi:hypothetical protein
VLCMFGLKEPCILGLKDIRPSVQIDWLDIEDS